MKPVLFLPALSFIVVGWSVAPGARAAAPATVPPAPAPAPAAVDRWEKDIAKFEAADKKTPPPKGAVLFVGSSSIVNWKTLARDFPDVATLNRGFGGSTIPDATRYVERIVIPYAPSRIVFYSGDNDIAGGRTPEQVLADFQAFVKKVRPALPSVPVTFIAIKPSPSRWKLRVQMQAANRMIREWIEKGDAGPASFLDVYTPMLGADGLPRPELYVADKLHLSASGYELWTRLVRPALTADRKP